MAGVLTGIAGALLTTILLPATAFAAEHDGQWHVNGELYLWGADTELTAVAGQEIDADFNAVLDNLEIAFMGTLGARKDRVSWFGDIMYVGIGASKTVFATSIQPPSRSW